MAVENTPRGSFSNLLHLSKAGAKLDICAIMTVSLINQIFLTVIIENLDGLSLLKNLCRANHFTEDLTLILPDDLYCGLPSNTFKLSA